MTETELKEIEERAARLDRIHTAGCVCAACRDVPRLIKALREAREDLELRDAQYAQLERCIEELRRK